MTKRQKVIDAIKHCQTDCVPYNIDFTMQEYHIVAEYLHDIEFGKKLGNHMNSIYYSGQPKEISPGMGYLKDDFGVIWNCNGTDKDIGVVAEYMLKGSSLTGYILPEPNEKEIRELFLKHTAIDSGNFTFGNIGFSMFERAWSLNGMENLLINMIEEPDFVNHLFDKICDYNIKIIEVGLEFPIDGFMFGDDWGQQKGLIMGPTLWREFIKPRMARMYSTVKKAGKYVLQHSCGDISEIFPDLIEIGLDVYQSFQPEIYDIKKIKLLYGNDLTFWGGISTQKLLPFATPEEIKKVTRETISIMGKDGGFIAGPTHSIPGDVPPENVIAMVEALQKQ